MTTRAIKRRRDDESFSPDWRPPGERAPSLLRDETPGAARIIALLALLIALTGALAMVMQRYGAQTVLGAVVGFGWGLFLLMLGMAGLLYHAFIEKDVQYRRLYGMFGGLLLGLGVIFSLLPAGNVVGAYFLSAGAPALALALCFVLSYARNETEQALHLLALRAVGVVGALLILVGVAGGVLSESFLMAQGIVYMLLGLLYVAAYIATQPAASNTSYWAGFALGVVGAVMILIALGFAVPFESLPLIGPYLGWVNSAFGWVRWLSGQPGSPFLFIYIGLEYLILAFAVCSDTQLMTLTRREFAAYFYSPVAYIVMVAFVFLAGLSFYVFVSYLVRASQGGRFGAGGGVPEPVLYYYLFGLLPIFAVVLMVPVITMRLFAEENRSGTMEMLLTAPVQERTVVLSKFLAALRFFLLLWYPWAVYLIALRVEGGEEFDYRALLSFLVALVAMGAGFVSIGMFFSSLTRNQIIAAILTFLAMVTPIILYFIRALAFQGESFGTNLLSYVSYIELWDETTRGVISPRYLLFHVSVAIFFIFLTIKVLESRRWR